MLFVSEAKATRGSDVGPAGALQAGEMSNFEKSNVPLSPFGDFLILTPLHRDSHHLEPAISQQRPGSEKCARRQLL